MAAGNGGMVCDKSYDRGNSNILGYVIVDYQEGWNVTEPAGGTVMQMAAIR